MTFETPVTKAQIRAGGVTFTVCTGRDEFYTYNVARVDTTRPPTWHVRLMSSPARFAAHTFLGSLNFGRGGPFPPMLSAGASVPSDVFNRAMLLVWEGSDCGE